MEFRLICDKQTCSGCFICAFFKMFVCLSSFILLLNGKLEFIEILLKFSRDFTSFVVLSCRICYLLLVQGHTLLYNLIKYHLNTSINSLQISCYFCDLNVASLLTTNLRLCHYYLCSQYLSGDNSSLVFC